jgi:hypothetical protein
MVHKAGRNACFSLVTKCHVNFLLCVFKKVIRHYRFIFVSVLHEVNISSKIRRGTIQANLLVDSTEQFFFQWFGIISESGKTTRRETPLCSMISDEEN